MAWDTGILHPAGTNHCSPSSSNLHRSWWCGWCGWFNSHITSLTAAADDDDIWWNLDIFPHNQMLTGWSWSVSPDCTVTSDQLILSSEVSAVIRIYDSIQELRFNKIVLFFMFSRSARKVNQIIWTTSAKFHRIAEICLKTKKLEFYTEIWNKVILTLRVESGATI